MSKNAANKTRFVYVTPQHATPSTTATQAPPRSTSEIKLKPAVKRTRQNVPAGQRKRVKYACDGCREKKEKCSGDIPCGKCVKSGIECSLSTSSKVESHQPEKRPSEAPRSLSDTYRIKLLETIVSRCLGGVSISDDDLKSMANSPVEPLRKYLEDNGEGDYDLSEENLSTKGLPQDITDYSGENSLLNLSRRLKQKIAQKIDLEVESDMPQNYNGSSVEPSHPATSSSPVHLLIRHLPNRQLAEFLVETFFKYTQCNNFYVDTEWLHRKLDTCYDDNLALVQGDIPGISTILMILAVGTQYSLMESSVSMEDLGHTLFDEVTHVIPSIITSRTLESVQACLLIGVYLFPVDQPGLAFTYLGLGLNIAIQNGMHRKSCHGGGLNRRREVENRVWWTLFIFYQQTSILHGHPNSISHVDVDVERPQRILELEPRSGTSNFENQLILIDLIIVLEDISREISILRKFPNATHFMNLISLRKKLITIGNSLPPVENGTVMEMRLDVLRLNLHLHLHYQRTCLFLGRPFLLANQEAQPLAPGASSIPAHGRNSYRETLIKASVSAALKIIDLCQVLYHRVGLAQASYSTEFTSCRAAMLVLLAASLTENSHKLREALSCGLKIIKTMSAGGGEQASSETRVIEALERAISRLNSYENNLRDTAGHSTNSNAIHLDNHDDIHNHNVSSENDHNHFKLWEMLWQKNPFSPVPDSSQALMAASLPANFSDSGAPVGEPFYNPMEQQYQNPMIGGVGQVFGSFPSELNEFSVIPEFDLELEQFQLGNGELGGFPENYFP